METNRRTITVENPSDEAFIQVARESYMTGMKECDVIIDKNKMKDYFKSKFSKRNIEALTDMEADDAGSYDDTNITTFQLYGISYFIK